MKVFSILLLATFIVNSAKQSKMDFPVSPQFEYPYANVLYQGKWTYINKKGEFLFNKKFFNAAVSFYWKTILFEDKGKYGFADFNNRVFIKPQFEHAYNFQLGYAAVSSNGKWGIIDKGGHFLVKPEYDQAGNFSIDSLAGVFKDGKLGFVNMKGELVIPCQYYWYPSLTVFPRYPVFADKLIEVYTTPIDYSTDDDISPQMIYLNTKGEVQISHTSEGPIQSAGYFFDGLASVKVNDKWGVINKKGNFVILPHYDYSFGFYDSTGLAEIRTDQGVGLISRKGEIILEPQKDFSILPFENGYAPVQFAGSDEDKVTGGYIDTTGKLAFNRKFGFTNSFYEGYASVEIDGKYGYVNSTGKTVIEPKFTIADRFTNGIAVVATGDYGQLKYGFINKQGKFVIEPTFNGAKEYSYEVAPVKIRKKWGYIDKKGNVIIQPKFDNAQSFTKDIFH